MYLGWDVGVKNLAYCLMDKDCNILKWDIIDLSNKKEYYCKSNNKNGNKCSSKALFISPITHELYCKRHSKNIENIKPLFECFLCKHKAKKINLIENNFYCCKHAPKDEKCEDVMTNKNVAKTSLNKIGNILIDKLDEIPEILNVTDVSIENQPCLKNPTMKSIQIMLYTYFLIRLKHKKITLTMVSAKNKLKFDIETEKSIELAKITNRYQKNKKMAIEFCRHFINNKENNNNNEWAEYFETNKKKDDLADSYLMTRHRTLKK
jgi:hypothetical protein